MKRLTHFALLTVCAFALPVAAEVYRTVDANGNVSFTDKPRGADAAGATGASASPGASGPRSDGGARLPYELQLVVGRYPVTLYTGKECAPCASGRAMLTTRGVPFTERTVDQPEDVDALQRLSGQNTLPLLSVGSQQLKGFSDAVWTQYLDAAGYAPSIALPRGYRNPTPTPLVASAPAPAAASSAPPASAPAVPATDPSGAVTPANPAGIKF